MRQSAPSGVGEAPPTARLFRSREPITESEWHRLGGGAAIGPTGRLERAGSAAGVHPLPPRPGRVMWLDQHRPHYGKNLGCGAAVQLRGGAAGSRAAAAAAGMVRALWGAEAPAGARSSGTRGCTGRGVLRPPMLILEHQAGWWVRPLEKRSPCCVV